MLRNKVEELSKIAAWLETRGALPKNDKTHDNITNVKYQKECYQCGVKVYYLFPDGRCFNCTRITPEEIQAMIPGDEKCACCGATCGKKYTVADEELNTIEPIEYICCECAA